ncbi:MAG: DUF1566 domain-containing protein, partial [Acidobacteriota bacterium]|nr:DUF1566 domain-containing protein [Acidobacteriota bacterium]
MVEQALTTPDKAFEATEQYKALIQLAAKIELEGPKKEAKAAAEQRLREVRARGYWVDDNSKLMWTVKDSGSDIEWNAADAYCRGMTLGGFTGWRLASIDELQRMYDASLPDGTWKTRGPIYPSGWTWSGTRNGSSEAWNFLFTDGQRYSHLLAYSYFERALCVR